MSDISRLMKQWWLLHHCLSVTVSLLCQRALQISHCAEPPGCIVVHAHSGQFLGLLLSDHSSTQLLRVTIGDVTILLHLHFDSLGRLECERYRIAQSTLGILLLLFSSYGSPSSSFLTDCDDLLWFCGHCSSAVLQTAMPFVRFSAVFSQLPLLKLIYSISFSLCLLFYLCSIRSPFLLLFNIWPLSNLSLTA